jgi:hypothetical protein
MSDNHFEAAEEGGIKLKDQAAAAETKAEATPEEAQNAAAPAEGAKPEESQPETAAGGQADASTAGAEDGVGEKAGTEVSTAPRKARREAKAKGVGGEMVIETGP